MKNIQNLIKGIEVLEVTGDTAIQIDSISFDSNTAGKNSLFVSAEGIENDGHDSVDEAIKSGAKAVVFQNEPKEKVPGVAYIKVADSRLTLGLIAQNFYGNPSRQLKLVGVTGTNGKTTTATLLFEIFCALGYKVALLSTVGNRINEQTFPTTHTTLTPVSLGAFLDQVVAAGAEYAFMECSSHGIEEERIAGLHFTGGIFTNLTQDHLDYHGTLEKYTEAKKKFFDRLPAGAFALANADDSRGRYMLSNTAAQKYFFAIDGQADFAGKGLVTSLEGSKFTINGKAIETKLIGRFNAYNTLGVYAAASLLGVPDEKLISILRELEPPTGRLQFVKSKDGIYGIVDYAHTPDAVENILKALREVRAPGSQLITVMGCGGDRDKTKRPIMGELGSRLSDYVIFTSDNPRSEDPEAILKDIVAGVPEGQKNHESLVNRAEAIEKGAKMAKPGDIVVIAGKGHEDYQIFADKTIHFSDLEELRKSLNV